MKIDFFQTSNGLDVEAVNGGVYKIELVNSYKKKTVCLYIGESTYIVKRCGEHLHTLYENPAYFGFIEEDMCNCDFTLKFSVAESILEKKGDAIYKDKEKKYILDCKPLTQRGNSDRQIEDIEEKVKVVQDFLVEQGFKNKATNEGRKMNKLFIIGNGFDLGHGLKTSYKDFNNYLEKTYSNERESYLGNYIDKEGDINFKKLVAFLNYLISEAEEELKRKCENNNIKEELWKDLEVVMGAFYYDYLFNDLEYSFGEDEEIEENKIATMRANISLELEYYVPMIRTLFSEWIKQIKVEGIKSKPSFTQLISKNDHFLSFNYTTTIEDLYGIENVCHIHGKQNETLLFGHGENKKKSSLDATDEDYDSYYIDIMDTEIGREGIVDLINDLKKDTEDAIDKHQDFFKNLSDNVDSVYSYGFSYGKVDLIYIKEILKYINNESCKWYLHKYNSKDHDQFIEKIRESGFIGSFFTFDC